MIVFSKKKGPVLALDLNSDRVALLQLDKTKAGVSLSRYASLPTPPNAVREGLIADPETMGSVLRELMEQAVIPVNPVPLVNLAVPAQSVVIRLMPVPTGMPTEELADVVAQEAINHVPFPMREANLDWAVMPATERTDPDGVTRVDVILAAIQKTIVDACWRMTEYAGVRLGRLDISALATIRALSFAGYLRQPDQLVMSVNIRHDATDINLVRNGMPLFSRSVLLGVETLGEAISRSLNTNLDEALSLLGQVPLFGMTAVDPRVGQAAQIARTVFGDITDEVGRSLEFYRSQVGDVVIDQIFLSGPGCTVPQLDQFLANRLNIQTVVVDPLRDVSFDPALIAEERRAGHTMVVGTVIDPQWLPLPTVDLDLNKEGPSAAVLEAIEERPTVRIVPEEAPWFKPVFFAGVAAMTCVGGLWAYFSQYDVPKKQAEITQLDSEIELGKKQLTTLSNLKEENAKLQQKKNVLNSIVHEGRPWADILEVVRNCTPQGMQIRKVGLSGSTISVEGQAVDFTKVSHFTINLQGSPMLSDSNIAWAKRQMTTDPRVIEFLVNARIKSESSSSDRLASRPQVLDFYADWCAPCQQLKPVLEEARRRYGETVEIVRVNADEPGNRPLLDRYKVQSIPTLCFLNEKGELVEKIVGFNGPEPIMAALERVSQIAASGGPR